MLNGEEKLLNSLKADYDNITIPENIDDFIKKGMVKHSKKKKVYQFARLASTAAVIALLILAVTIRLSPVFADYLQDVPVLKYIVKLVNYDKGLKAAVENNFIQNIGVSDEHAGIKFTVDSIIVDEARMIVFYTIENNSEYKSIYMNKAGFTDTGGNDLEISCSFGFMYDKAKSKKIQDKINVSFAEGISIPDTMRLKIGLLERYEEPGVKPEQLPYTWQVDIPIDKNKFKNLKQIYNVNQTIEVEGQKITINKATVYPTRMSVDLSFAEDNTKRIFSFENITIINAKGETLPTVSNDVIASLISDDHMILYFESDFFNNPESLYLHIGSIRALDKDKVGVLVDLDEKKLLKAPDERLTLKDITISPDETNISFLLKGDVFQENQTRFSVSSSGVYDKNGKKLKVLSTSNSQRNNPEDPNQEILITLENGSYESPIKVMLNDYPSRIKGNLKIKLK